MLYIGDANICSKITECSLDNGWRLKSRLGGVPPAVRLRGREYFVRAGGRLAAAQAGAVSTAGLSAGIPAHAGAISIAGCESLALAWSGARQLLHTIDKRGD